MFGRRKLERRIEYLEHVVERLRDRDHDHDLQAEFQRHLMAHIGSDNILVPTSNPWFPAQRVSIPQAVKAIVDHLGFQYVPTTDGKLMIPTENEDHQAPAGGREEENAMTDPDLEWKEWKGRGPIPAPAGRILADRLVRE